MEQVDIPLHRFADRFAEQDPINIRHISVSAQQVKQRMTLPPHRHDFYEICLFKKASGVHHLDWNPYPIHDKSVFVLSPDTVHLIQLQGEVQGHIISFDKDFVCANLDDRSTTLLAFLAQHSPFTAADFSSLHTTVEELLREMHSQAPCRETMLNAYVQILLVQLLRCQELAAGENASLTAKNKTHSKMDLFRELLEARYKEHMSVQEYAAHLAVSVKQLNRICKAAAGKTASACIQERLNTEAKRLLYNTMLSIKEIAFTLGFRESSHFSHFFFKQNGMFPHFFREMVLTSRE